MNQTDLVRATPHADKECLGYSFPLIDQRADGINLGTVQALKSPCIISLGGFILKINFG